MRFPTVFINHGGGPLPLLGKQPRLVESMKEVVQNFLPPKPPKAIVIFSAHWESNPIQITSSPNPSMLFDYYGFPPESYTYSYPAPGSPDLAQRIHSLLEANGLPSELNDTRGFDHGVFIPLMIMYPEANIPVVCVSLHDSLSAETNMKIGEALASLRERDEDEILIIGSGYSFHNMQAFFNASPKTIQASLDFNDWLKDTVLGTDKCDTTGESRGDKLRKWATAPGGRISHPREEHLLPLLMVAAAAGDNSKARLIYDSTAAPADETKDDPQGRFQLAEHAVSGYLFE